MEVLDAPFNRRADGTRACDFPGCPDEGQHSAPKAPDRLEERYWFCQHHARLYNTNWNYYKGMTIEEIERLTRYDTVWRRPTWPLGQGITPQTRVKDETGLFGDVAPPPEDPRFGPKEKAALAELGLNASADLGEIRARYKHLVKKLHPDANQSDAKSEERLKRINQAYSVLKTCFNGAATQ